MMALTWALPEHNGQHIVSIQRTANETSIGAAYLKGQPQELLELGSNKF
jgi:hypothetical protein